jgi:Kef-type K+ transport system membrane component KefB
MQFLENVLHAPPALAELRTVDEAVVIGAALSLSSSAFVLQLLRERGELDTRFGQATLGILLLQDIATVPFLVLLPLVEGSNAGGAPPPRRARYVRVSGQACPARVPAPAA